jgi:hypothetical protein
LWVVGLWFTEISREGNRVRNRDECRQTLTSSVGTCLVLYAGGQVVFREFQTSDDSVVVDVEVILISERNDEKIGSCAGTQNVLVSDQESDAYFLDFGDRGGTGVRHVEISRFGTSYDPARGQLERDEEVVRGGEVDRRGVWVIVKINGNYSAGRVVGSDVRDHEGTVVIERECKVDFSAVRRCDEFLGNERIEVKRRL